MFLVSSCIYLCPIHWSRVFRREWRFSWSSADRHQRVTTVTSFGMDRRQDGHMSDDGTRRDRWRPSVKIQHTMGITFQKERTWCEREFCNIEYRMEVQIVFYGCRSWHDAMTFLQQLSLQRNDIVNTSECWHPNIMQKLGQYQSCRCPAARINKSLTLMKEYFNLSITNTILLR